MQNAVDIMAMVQKTSTIKPRFDVPSKASSSPYNFRDQLNEARKANYGSDAKDTEVRKDYAGRTNENRTEKLAKVMSNSNAKPEVKDQEQVQGEKIVQGTEAVDETKTVDKAAGSEEKNDEKTVTAENLQDLLQMLQDLLQQIQNMEGQESGNLQDTKAALQSMLESLEQKLTAGQEIQAVETGKLVSDLQNQLTKLVQSMADNTKKEDKLPKVEQLLKQLMQKVEELSVKEEAVKTDAKRVVNERITTAAPQKTTEEAKVDNTSAQLQPIAEENTEPKEVIAEKKNSKDAKEDQDQDHSSYKQSSDKIDTKAAVEPAKAPNQLKTDFVVAPQNSKQDIQVVIKQLDTNLQKQNLVTINKSDIINQVVKKADIFIGDSHQEMIMKLEPESLGKLNLKVVVENGIITAKFVAESQQVKEVLESSFNQLKDALQEKGIAVQGFSVSVGQQGGEFQSQQGFNQWKRAIKLNHKVSGDYLALDEDGMTNNNPYNYHEGKVDFKA